MKAIAWLLLLALMAAAAADANEDRQARRHHHHRTCGRTFFSSLLQLRPCRPAVAPFSTIPPSEPCCAAVRALGQPCLCLLLNGPPITGVDRDMARALPDQCDANFDPCDGGA